MSPDTQSAKLEESSGDPMQASNDFMSMLNKMKSKPVPSSLLQIDEETEPIKAVFKHGKVELIKGEFKGESPQLAQPYSFHILGLSDGQFKVKTLNRTHLSEMYEMFDDI